MRRLAALPALAVLGALFALPMGMLFVVSFWTVRSFRLAPDVSLAAWTRALESYGGIVLTTLGIGLVVGALCTLLGFVFAYGVRFRAGRWGDALILMALITLFGGYLVKIYAWKAVLAADGVINVALIALGLTDAPIAALIYTPGAVVVALVHFLLPFAILPIYASLRNLSDLGIEAARDLGATPWQIVARVVVPQVRRGLFAAFALTFLGAAGDYVTPQFLGGGSGMMAGQFISQEFSTRFNWPAGAALSFTLLAACGGVLAAAALVLFGPARGKPR